MSLADCAIWGGVALVVQIAVFLVLRLFLPNLSDRIAANETAAAGFVAAVSVGVGLLNAASMSY